MWKKIEKNLRFILLGIIDGSSISNGNHAMNHGFFINYYPWVVNLGVHQDSNFQKIAIFSLTKLTHWHVFYTTFIREGVVITVSTFQRLFVWHFLCFSLPAGRLLDFIITHYSISYTEGVACNFVENVVQALHYLHLNGIAHLDLKVSWPNHIDFDSTASV